jgi:hypothetical protein
MYLTTQETGLILIKSHSRGPLMFASSVLCCFSSSSSSSSSSFSSKFRVPQLKTKEAITKTRHMTTFRNLSPSRSVVLFTKEAIPR